MMCIYYFPHRLINYLYDKELSNWSKIFDDNSDITLETVCDSEVATRDHAKSLKIYLIRFCLTNLLR